MVKIISIKKILFPSFTLLCSLVLSGNLLFAQELSFEINDTGHAFFEPNIDVDSSGQFIAVWADYRHCPEYGGEEGGAAIYIQRFDTTGVKSGNNVRMDEKSDYDVSNTNPDVAINKTNGDFVIVWQERSGSSENDWGESRIMASIFKDDLSPLTFQFVVENNNTIRQAFPEVTYLANNNILILWLENRGDGLFYYAKLFAPFGVPISEKFKANSNHVPGIIHFDALPSSGFYIVWDRYIQVYDNSGSPVTSVLEGPFQYVNATKSLNANDILIVTRDEYQRRIEGIIYHVDQNSYGERFRIDDDTKTLNRRGGSDIAVNQSGEFIVVWQDYRNDYTNLYDVLDVYGQRFDNNAHPIGSNFKVNHEETETGQYDPKVSFYHNRFVAIFTQGRISGQTVTVELPPVHIGVFDLSKSRSYIVGTSQDFSNPTPGPVFGWEYLLPPPAETFDASRPAYPNPFIKQIHGFVSIEFDLEKGADVSLDIYNMLGQRIKKLYSGSLPGGFYRAKWYGTTQDRDMAASGLYFCILRIDGQVFNKKITFINKTVK